jgi:hypothetical protein
MEKTIAELLDELSFLSRETTGASFVIQHSKDNGQWKVVFSNAMTTVRHCDRLKYTDFKTSLISAIEWIRAKRRHVEVPIEKYTMY